MRRDRQEKSKPVTALVISMAVLAKVVCFAQNQPPNPAQDALDFMNSPQGTNAANKAQLLIRVSAAKIAFSNELVRVSADTTLALPIRQSATDALQTYDKSATNTFQEIETYVATWPFTVQEPPMTTDTILVLKRGLEIGDSGLVHLKSFLCDTNLPSFYREKLSQVVTNMFHNATH